jgi:putative ABC transport system permease protein
MNSPSPQDAFSRVCSRPLTILRRTPRPVLFTLVALALGLGVNTAIYFRAYFAVLTPYPQPDELVRLRPEMLGVQGVMIEDFILWKTQTTVFQELGASTDRVMTMKTRGDSMNVTASLVTPRFYRMMGDRFSLGDDFAPEEGTHGSKRQVILANSMWKQLGANPDVIGSILFMDSEPYTVVGVLAAGLRDQGASVTIPLILTPGLAKQNDLELNVIGRLQPGISLREAQVELDAIVGQIPHSLSNSDRAWSVSVEPLRSAAFANDRKLLIWLLVGGAAFLPLLEGASVVNLLRLRSDAMFSIPYRRGRHV